MNSTWTGQQISWEQKEVLREGYIYHKGEKLERYRSGNWNYRVTLKEE
jgi:hypothetical protein